MGGGGFRGSKMQKSGKSTKRLERLAPNLVHVCRFIWEWTNAQIDIIMLQLSRAKPGNPASSV